MGSAAVAIAFYTRGSDHHEHRTIRGLKRLRKFHVDVALGDYNLVLCIDVVPVFIFFSVREGERMQAELCRILCIRFLQP
uniref:Secreted protein n=1 Tax=Panagrellus redivivus TaxID=6233 RepID=A0A7E4V427_PANRE